MFRYTNVIVLMLLLVVSGVDAEENSAVNQIGKLLSQVDTVSIDGDGKIFDIGDIYGIGDFMRDESQPAVWKKEMVNIVRLGPEWELVNDNQQKKTYRKVAYFFVYGAEVEYVYCQKVLAVDGVTGKPAWAPKILKKTGKQKNRYLMEKIKVNTGEEKQE